MYIVVWVLLLKYIFKKDNMSNFPRFDGITLSGNAWIENLYVERLAVDPVRITDPGRLWFNTVDNRMSWSAVDPDGNMTVYDYVTPPDLTLLANDVKSYTDSAIITAAIDNTHSIIGISASLINTQALLINVASRSVTTNHL